jgi:hypothetical protein
VIDLVRMIEDWGRGKTVRIQIETESVVCGASHARRPLIWIKDSGRRLDERTRPFATLALGHTVLVVSITGKEHT